MYEILFYRERNGSEPVFDYMQSLSQSKSKDSRIKLSKMQDYIKILEVQGTSAGVPYIKHLDGEIWELRPIRNRVLFAGVVGNRYVLLHVFMKSTQKTPVREIEQAKRELADFKERSGLYD